MFTITIHLKDFVRHGLEALDIRRRLKLPDDSVIVVNSGPIKTTVSEAFARARFPSKNQTEVGQYINFDHLTPEDVQLDSNGRVELRPDMPTTRVQELWLSARS